MTAREKRLAIAVAGIVMLIVNYLLVEYFFVHQHLLRGELQTKSSDLRLKRMLFEEKDLWEKRNAWLQKNQPKLTNESGSGVALLDQVKEAASKHSVLLEAPAINTLQKKSDYVSVSVNFETKSSWETLCAFLRELQGPERFIVFESTSLQRDDADKTQMRGRFRVARWFAPR